MAETTTANEMANEPQASGGEREKVILAYSGGLDTSVLIKWLSIEKNFDVICVSGDLGQDQDDMQQLKDKALKCGAVDCLVVDMREDYANEYLSKALVTNALYEDKYPLLSALSRPLIAKHLVNAAHAYGAKYVAHGCTGKGNDQVRLDTSVMMLDPSLTVLAPVREWDLQTRPEEMDWAEAHGCVVYVDGARMANALEAEGNDLSLRHIASRAAALTLGGTKNGMLFGEAVLITHPRLKEAFPYLQKERGGLLAKGRLLGVQFQAALEGDSDALYWKLARHANEMAMQLRRGLCELGYRAFSDSTTNQQFFTVPEATGQRLCDEFGCEVFDRLPDGRWVIRFVCSWATRPESVDDVLAVARDLER